MLAFRVFMVRREDVASSMIEGFSTEGSTEASFLVVVGVRVVVA
jgi:hypothetical protein